MLSLAYVFSESRTMVGVSPELGSNSSAALAKETASLEILRSMSPSAEKDSIKL